MNDLSRQWTNERAHERLAITHEVRNQVPPLENFNAFTADKILAPLLDAYGASWAKERAGTLGAIAGSAKTQELARLANKFHPELKTHDRFGHRIDWVDFHPAWHELMSLAFGNAVHSLAWTAKENEPRPHFARAVLSYLWNQAENGVGCPAGMTYAGVPEIRADASLAGFWAPKLLSTNYDPRPLAPSRKNGCIIGMAMTEKQGGSDLRQTETRAYKISAGEYGEYELVGHKWFTSVPVSDAFLTLAQTDRGVSCFFFQRFFEDGTRNPLAIQRLKDKCGNRSNASSEIELNGTRARLVGEEGHGIRAILSMAHLTRLDFAVGSAGLMRYALSLAIHHASHRLAFGAPLADQPMMANTLADLAIEVEAATLLALRLAVALDESGSSEKERLLARIGTPMAKYWNCKRAPHVVVEALECHGGNGFVEENPTARLYREAPLNAIWEGTSNMMCMDVMRALQREPGTRDAFMAELESARGANADLDRAIDRVAMAMQVTGDLEPRARRTVEWMALSFAGAQLARRSTQEVLDAFCASRLGGDWGREFGTLPAATPFARIIERSRIAA